ncbi:polysaccharide deacetylase family protein [Streptosporangium sp. NPDC051023]|uniref:polysaccharide deacetylase family protein n=1 Tax=Streptosporangium sp. NPDC051023 TaxID=3155410 RepID=UPI00344BAC29
MKIVYRMGTLLAMSVVLAMSAPVLPAEAARTAAPPRKVTTVVSLTFDDGDATHPSVARMLERRGMRGTFYVNTGAIGHTGKLTRGQVIALARAGHEVGGHTLTHVRLDELTRDEQRGQICDDRRTLVRWGLRPATLAYPFGAVDADAKAVARGCGYDAARTVGGLRRWGCLGCPAGETPRPKDRYGIRTPGSVREDTSLRQLKQQVLNAEKGGGGLLPLVFHRVCDACGVYSVPPKVMNEFLDWLAARGTRGTVVKTLEEAVGARYRPLPPE